ncbi:MAG: sel1 repeat family protein [Clostridium sp.]|nr:sel1 repeat family protein [Acetatifactor muris]MCM1526784.1 sel1 repeat family protein [Bacteroides sp.]MCM1563015.1 sel1 repeat family protein [Clostridium sp.]
MEKLLKSLGIDETADAEEIVGKLELKQSEIMERLDNVEDEARRRKLEEDLKQIETAITAFSWMKGKEQTGIARDEDEETEDFADLKGQKTKEDLYNEALAMLDTPDYAKGVEMMRNSAENGYAPAMYLMGWMYFSGTRVEKNEFRAVEWFQKAAERGDANAQSLMGDFCALGQGAQQDHSKALEWYCRAAEQGNAGGQYGLGSMYRYGWAVAQNRLKAIEWYQKAAEQGHMESLCAMATMYYYGEGIAPDEARAVELWQKAAEQGYEKARSKLRELGENQEAK